LGHEDVSCFSQPVEGQNMGRRTVPGTGCFLDGDEP